MVSFSNNNPLERIYSLKHEPRVLEEIAGHEESKERLERLISSRSVTHLLLAGPPGSGKLTLAKCFARDLLGTEMKAALGIVHVSNPLTSEERKAAKRDSYVSKTRIGSKAGLKFTWPKFIQMRVKPFVELKAMNALGYKILIVTDFHLLGNDQQGFRRLMEMYGRNCRFILLTSQISSIIDPIISRCQILLISPVSKARFYKEVKSIGNKEDFKVNYTFINSLYHVTRGNIGLALNYIQMMILRGWELTGDKLFQLLKKVVDTSGFTRFLELAMNGKYLDARNLYFSIKKEAGYTFTTFLETLHEKALHAPISQSFKAHIVDTIAMINAKSLPSSSDEPHLFQLVYALGQLVADGSP
ncbi:hypothetical protein GF325_10240 [Candidatus Bathyarchaeota archaeon]|nr:hypothetical protein [Candidatus Bathyarchaeota archaeon]